ncbi:uncharacterized protein LOC101861227 [Aplysia californica]|uniref:Uncharacterized protein LOC101861227 n=1 Tax=Aplysia californica TaxID=6500 RepID=A0ABM0K0V1_APLCA|nr:uncharacterized protein LOC101861227 [Aplysia californica]
MIVNATLKSSYLWEHVNVLKLTRNIRVLLTGMPPHLLTLRKDSIVMLLRNLDPTNGYCNETRYVVQHLHQHVIDAVVACRQHAGKRLFIPRIPLMPSDNIFPFHVQRKQSPKLKSFVLNHFMNFMHLLGFGFPLNDLIMQVKEKYKKKKKSKAFR